MSLILREMESESQGPHLLDHSSEFTATLLHKHPANTISLDTYSQLGAEVNRVLLEECRRDPSREDTWLDVASCHVSGPFYPV